MSEPRGPRATEVEPLELLRKLERGEALTVVDIREAEEFASWRIAGAISVPSYDALRAGRPEPLLAGAGRLPRDRPLVAVCRQGIVSRRAVAVLASLGYEAASLRGGMRAWGAVWSEAKVPLGKAGAVLVQLRRNGKGCLSYLFGGAGEAAVVDPSVDPAAYEGVASREGLRIRFVLETHVHADHLSRARELCERTGARLLMPPNDRVRRPFEPLREGEPLAVGGLEVEPIATPGHTGESTCYLLSGEALLTGDTLFLDGVGRPDLERGDAGAEPSARCLWRSLRDLLGRLSRANPLVLPAHEAAPVGFDGAPIAAPLREVEARVAVLREGEEAFVSRVVGGLGPKPPNFDRIIAINEGKAALGPQDPLDLEAGPNRCAAG